MDAVKFIEELRRMCDTYKDGCAGCPMDGKQCGALRGVDAEELVTQVEMWSAAHPRKTRQSEFLEQWPNAIVDNAQIVSIAPCVMDSTQNNFDCANRSCDTCRREFWMQEVKW